MHTPVRIAKRKKTRVTQNAGEDAEKPDLSRIAGGNVKWYSCPGKECGQFRTNKTGT